MGRRGATIKKAIHVVEVPVPEDKIKNLIKKFIHRDAKNKGKLRYKEILTHVLLDVDDWVLSEKARMKVLASLDGDEDGFLELHEIVLAQFVISSAAVYEPTSREEQKKTVHGLLTEMRVSLDDMFAVLQLRSVGFLRLCLEKSQKIVQHSDVELVQEMDMDAWEEGEHSHDHLSSTHHRRHSDVAHSPTEHQDHISQWAKQHATPAAESEQKKLQRVTSKEKMNRPGSSHSQSESPSLTKRLPSPIKKGRVRRASTTMDSSTASDLTGVPGKVRKAPSLETALIEGMLRCGHIVVVHLVTPATVQGSSSHHHMGQLHSPLAAAAKRREREGRSSPRARKGSTSFLHPSRSDIGGGVWKMEHPDPKYDADIIENEIKKIFDYYVIRGEEATDIPRIGHGGFRRFVGDCAKFEEAEVPLYKLDEIFMVSAGWDLLLDDVVRAVQEDPSGVSAPQLEMGIHFEEFRGLTIPLLAKLLWPKPPKEYSGRKEEYECVPIFCRHVLLAHARRDDPDALYEHFYKGDVQENLRLYRGVLQNIFAHYSGLSLYLNALDKDDPQYFNTSWGWGNGHLRLSEQEFLIFLNNFGIISMRSRLTSRDLTFTKLTGLYVYQCSKKGMERDASSEEMCFSEFVEAVLRVAFILFPLPGKKYKELEAGPISLFDASDRDAAKLGPLRRLVPNKWNLNDPRVHRNYRSQSSMGFTTPDSKGRTSALSMISSGTRSESPDSMRRLPLSPSPDMKMSATSPEMRATTQSLDSSSATRRMPPLVRQASWGETAEAALERLACSSPPMVNHRMKRSPTPGISKKLNHKKSGGSLDPAGNVSVILDLPTPVFVPWHRNF